MEINHLMMFSFKIMREWNTIRREGSREGKVKRHQGEKKKES